METIGSLIDKLSINELKIYHVKEQAARSDVDCEFKRDCAERLDILDGQRYDLCLELQEFLNSLADGSRKLKVYRQLKMYNEKKCVD